MWFVGEGRPHAFPPHVLVSIAYTDIHVHITFIGIHACVHNTYKHTHTHAHTHTLTHTHSHTLTRARARASAL